MNPDFWQSLYEACLFAIKITMLYVGILMAALLAYAWVDPFYCWFLAPC